MAAFADNTRLSKAIRGEATEEDMFLLSMDLHRVISWALANNMELNIVERYVSNVFYSERIVRVFYSQSDKILGVFYPK